MFGVQALICSKESRQYDNVSAALLYLSFSPRSGYKIFIELSLSSLVDLATHCTFETHDWVFPLGEAE